MLLLHVMIQYDIIQCDIMQCDIMIQLMIQYDISQSYRRFKYDSILYLVIIKDD